MDLKIGKDKRVRIGKREHEELSAKSFVHNKFVLTENIQFNVEVSVDRSIQKSTVLTSADGLSLVMTPHDFENLTSARNAKNGVWIGDFLVQVDLWGAEKRV